MDDESTNDQFELDIPIYIALKQSQYAYNDLGTYTRMQLSPDQFLGSFKGKTKKSMSQCADPNFVWTILSSRQIPLFYIDASDPRDSNWLRFIRSTTDPNKYNVICMQQNQQINYFTFREIKIGEELVTYLPGKKKKSKNKMFHNVTYKLADDLNNETNTKQQTDDALIEEEVELEQDENGNILKHYQNQQQNDRLDDQTQVQKQLKENMIDFKMLTQDFTKTNDYFFTFDFHLKINNLKKLRRRLIKCDLCSFTQITDSTNDDSIVKNHLLNQHLDIKLTETNNNNLDLILNDIKNYLINQIESDSYMCDYNQFNSTFKYICNQDGLKFDLKKDILKHIDENHSYLNSKITCFYCSDQFDIFKSSKDYLNHLGLNHKDEIVLDQLLTKQDINHNVDCLNWDEYFQELESEDNSAKSPITNQISSNNNNNNTNNKPVKTWTCQMCKKQFDQRIDLSKHQCIELHLRLLKKKKELRKKKWRESHWKRKIDLSYIETTSLTQMSTNIADNLGFCIDGTQEDLKAYSREVRDYLNTELGNETEIQMYLKCCFPDMYQSILKQFTNLTESNAGQLVDTNILKKANSYFMQSNSKLDLCCKYCKGKFFKLNDFILHQKQTHKFDLKTSYQNFKSTQLITSPIGYLSCDPIAYLLNLHWDKEIRLKCTNCNLEMQRNLYKSHLIECNKKLEDAKIEHEKKIRKQETEIINDENELIIFSAKIITPPPQPELETNNEVEIQENNNNDDNKNENDDQDSIKEYINEIINELIVKIEDKLNTEPETNTNSKTSITTRRRKRTAQELLEEHLGSNNIIVNKKRSLIQTVKEQPKLIVEKPQTRKSARSINSSINESQSSNSITPVKQEQSPSTNTIRSSPRNQKQKTEPINEINIRPRQGLRSSQSSLTSSQSSFNNSPIKEVANNSSSSISSKNESLITVKMVNNRKIHVCEKCHLEFTSSNSVLRHQEKSCLRVKVISLSNSNQKKKCPICSSVFYNTHRLSIHIYRHHKNLLGSSNEPVLAEAKRLNELQLNKIKKKDLNEFEDDFDDENDQEESVINDLNDDECLNVSFDEVEIDKKNHKFLNTTI